ncbi:hypothetical protein T484DRAFT_1910203, partial [Baffinella frigidus]
MLLRAGSPRPPRATCPRWARPGTLGPTSTRTRAASTTACSSSSSLATASSASTSSRAVPSSSRVVIVSGGWTGIRLG